MAQLITREELALVLDDETISTATFDALYAIGLRIISAAYSGDPEEATGHAANVISGVLFAVLARIKSNPMGARQLVAGAASVTFGGSDVEVNAIFHLTAAEAADLASVSPGTSARTGAFTIRPGRGR